MTKTARYHLISFFMALSAGFAMAAVNGPIRVLTTQYIAPVDNPTWEASVAKSSYGTGEGFKYSAVIADNRINYAIQIAGNAYYAFNKFPSGDITLPGSFTRSCLTSLSPAKRYLYPPSLDYPEYIFMKDGYPVSGVVGDQGMERLAVDFGLDSTSTGAVYVQCVHTDYVYKVTFKPNGASGSDKEQIYTNAAKLAHNTFSRTGYTFLKWNTAQDGKGEDFSDGKAVKDRTLVLYALWDANSCEISVGAAGRGFASGGGTYDYDKSFKITATVTEDGYHFAHWKKDGVIVSYSNPYTVTAKGDAVYVAYFEPNEYTVSFDANGGSGVKPGDVSTAYAESVVMPNNPFRRSGYDFVGWSESRDGSKHIYKAGETVSELKLTTQADAVVTLYAVWRKIVYNLVLHKNDGSTSTMNTTVSYGEVPQSVTPPVRTGYTFLGYFNLADNVCYLDQSGVGVGKWNRESGGELSAKWSANSYTVSFEPGAPESEVSGEMPNMTFRYDEEQTLAKNLYKRRGYKFLGWAESAGGAVRYFDAQAVVNLTAEADAVVRLYAVWVRDFMTVRFDASGGMVVENGEGEYVAENTYVSGEAYGVLPAVTNADENALFAGWWTGTNLVDSMQVTAEDFADSAVDVLYARWKSVVEREMCAVTFKTSAADAGVEILVGMGTEIGALMPPAPVHADEKYAFFGWFDANDNRFGATSVVTAPLTVTARWTRREFNEFFGCRDLAFDTESTEGVGEWFVDSAESEAQSGMLVKDSTELQVSRLRAWAETSGTLSFDWRVSCGLENPSAGILSYLAFNANDVGLEEEEDDGDSLINGERDWTGEVHSVARAQYATWRYFRNRDKAQKNDCGGVRNLVWTPDPVASAIDGWTSIPAVIGSAPSAKFSTGGRVGWELTGDPAVVAATNGTDGCSDWIALEIDGPGELTFDWRVSCEPGYVDTNGTYVICDYLGLFVDDAEQPVVFIDGERPDMTTCVYTNTASGRHVYRWRYVKDGSIAAGADAAWLANAAWTPLVEPAEGETFVYIGADGQERSVTVPNSWVDEHGLLSPGSGDYRAALEGSSGKTGFGGAPIALWQEYLAGTDPNDPDDVFRITAIAVTNGTVTLAWSPDLRAAEPPREYQVLGRTRLDDPSESWAPTNAASRFFRVDVHMK